MSQQKGRGESKMSSQAKSSGEVDEIVNRLNTQKKTYEPKDPDRRTKVEPKMSNEDIQAMVNRLHSSNPNVKPKTAYEQGGVMLSYSNTGWNSPGSGGKTY